MLEYTKNTIPKESGYYYCHYENDFGYRETLPVLCHWDVEKQEWRRDGIFIKNILTNVIDWKNDKGYGNLIHKLKITHKEAWKNWIKTFKINLK